MASPEGLLGRASSTFLVEPQENPRGAVIFQKKILVELKSPQEQVDFQKSISVHHF
jgi:hypothetical protein